MSVPREVIRHQDSSFSISAGETPVGNVTTQQPGHLGNLSKPSVKSIGKTEVELMYMLEISPPPKIPLDQFDLVK